MMQKFLHISSVLSPIKVQNYYKSSYSTVVVYVLCMFNACF